MLYTINAACDGIFWPTYPDDSLLVGVGRNIFVTISFGGDLNEKFNKGFC